MSNEVYYSDNDDPTKILGYFLAIRATLYLIKKSTSMPIYRLEYIHFYFRLN